MQKNARTALASLVAGSAIAAVGLLAGAAEARRAAVLVAPPASIGVVDLAALFDRLAESADWDLRIRELEARSIDGLRARNAEIESAAKELEAMADGPEKEAQLDALRLKRLQAQEWANFVKLEVDREKSLKWQAVYRSVREGAKRLAETEGYDLVLVDDSRIDVRTQRSQSAPSLEAQAQTQISSLRVLHARKSVDVTEKLVVQLNNMRAATPAAGGTTSAATPR